MQALRIRVAVLVLALVCTGVGGAAAARHMYHSSTRVSALEDTLLVDWGWIDGERVLDAA
jgi:hypothetical protein